MRRTGRETEGEDRRACRMADSLAAKAAGERTEMLGDEGGEVGEVGEEGIGDKGEPCARVRASVTKQLENTLSANKWDIEGDEEVQNVCENGRVGLIGFLAVGSLCGERPILYFFDHSFLADFKALKRPRCKRRSDTGLLI